MRPTVRNARVGLCLIIAIFLSGSPAIAQSFDVVTMVDGTAAKAIALAAQQSFAGSIPTVTALHETVATVRQDGSIYHVEIARNSAEKQIAAYQVDPVTSHVVSAATADSAARKGQQLSGNFVAALLLSRKSLGWSESLLKSAAAGDVQLNVPYENLPDVIYVVHMPKRFKNQITSPPSVGATTVTLGCDPFKEYSVNVRTHLVTDLKPVC